MPQARGKTMDIFTNYSKSFMHAADNINYKIALKAKNVQLFIG